MDRAFPPRGETNSKWLGRRGATSRAELTRWGGDAVGGRPGCTLSQAWRRPARSGPIRPLRAAEYDDPRRDTYDGRHRDAEQQVQRRFIRSSTYRCIVARHRVVQTALVQSRDSAEAIRQRADRSPPIEIRAPTKIQLWILI